MPTGRLECGFPHSKYMGMQVLLTFLKQIALHVTLVKKHALFEDAFYI